MLLPALPPAFVKSKKRGDAAEKAAEVAAPKVQPIGGFQRILRGKRDIHEKIYDSRKQKRSQNAQENRVFFDPLKHTGTPFNICAGNNIFQIFQIVNRRAFSGGNEHRKASRGDPAGTKA